MSKISLPTAIVLGVFVVGWIVLAALGKPIPPWMMAAGAIVGKIVLSLMPQLFGSDSGGGTLSAGSSTGPSAGGAVPPASLYRSDARRTAPPPLRRRMILAPAFSILRIYGFPAALGFAIGLSSSVVTTGCAANGAPPPAVVQDVTIGLNAAICVIGTYSSDLSSGRSEVDAIADCVIKCGVTAAQATGLLDAHHKAETLEHAPPAAKKVSLEDQARRALDYMRRNSVPPS